MSENLEHIDAVNLITKRLAKEADERELQLLENWIATDSSNKKLFEEFEKSWQSTDKVKELSQIDIDSEWSRLEAAIDVDVRTSEDHSGNLNLTVRRIEFGRIFKIAAVWILFILSASGIYYIAIQQSYEQIIARAETAEGEFHDGSKITLNRNSSVKYPSDFGEELRKVILEGEAFFEVKRDEKRPFIVDAGPILIEVLGTSFYINANKENNTIVVIVKSGKVGVTTEKDESETIILEAGDQAIFSKNKKTLTKSVNGEVNYLSWKTKKLIFKKKKLIHVVNTLNKVYQGNIFIKDKKIKNCRISVTFNEQSLDEVLNVLKATLDIDITKKESSVELSGEGC